MSDTFYVDDVKSAKELSSYLRDIEFKVEDHPEGKVVKTPNESIIILNNYIKYVNFPSEKIECSEEDLIFGKNKLEKIVAIEINDGSAEIFTQNEDGSVKSEFTSHSYWILTSALLDKNATKLNGKQNYKYENLFSTKEEYNRFVTNNRYKDMYQIWNEKEAFMVREGYTYFKGLKHDEVSILSFDIESNGLIKNDSSQVILISNTFRKNGKVTKKLFAYNDFKDCGEMIYEWAKWVREVDPSIICGHNILGFDIPYIQHVASNYNISCDLGRDGSPWFIYSKESKFRVDGSRDLHYHKVNIYGRNVIDTMFLAYRYDIGRQYESYGLKYIIKKEGLEKENRVFYDAGKIKDNYLDPVEFEKIREYCQDDGDDALALYDKFSPTSFYLARTVPKPFQTITESASGSQINSVMVRAYYQYGFSIPKASETGEFQGAISFGIPGIYDNVMKIDFRALYPSIMSQFEVYDKYKDPNKFFPTLVDYFMRMREEYRAEYKKTNNVYYDNLQNVAKVVANSTYGFLSTVGLNFNSPSNAAFITAKGREFLKTSILWATGIEADEWIKIFEEKTK